MTAAQFQIGLAARAFRTVLADPPWQFINRTGKVAPEHRRLNRYDTMTVRQICALPVAEAVADTAHLYLWVPNALLPDGLVVLGAWGFAYKSNIIWHKLRKDGGSDGRGVGFYFRNVAEILLFGVRGKNARTEPPGRTQVNYMGTRKREHSRKPMSNTRSSRAAVPAPISNCSRAVPAPAGHARECRQPPTTSRPGGPIRTIRPASGACSRRRTWDRLCA